MTKYIRFTMRDGKQFTLPFDRAEKLINSPQTLVKLTNDKGFWTGTMVNKSEIIKTEPDIEREREEIIKLGQPEIDPPLTPEQEEKNQERWKKMRSDVEKLGILKTNKK